MVLERTGAIVFWLARGSLPRGVEGGFIEDERRKHEI
jgi:hypothetical protein